MNKLLLFFCLLASTSVFSDLKSDLDNQINPLMDKVIEWRHDIHQNPELSNREFRTAKKVEAHLLSLGIKVETKIAYTGVVGLIEGGLPGPTIALRADMDGLPVIEKTGLPFASKKMTEYLGQSVGVMHACGHDAHVAILMGVAEFLAKNKDQLKGNVMLIFQPAEEGPPEGENGGAKMMLEEGIFETYDPEVIFGLHVGNGPHGYIGISSGPAMAAAGTYRIKIKGVQAHGSRPWDSIDPIMASAELIQNLNTIVSRRINIVNNPAVISVGIIRSGTRGNIIPEDSEIQGTIRTFDPKLREEIYDEIRQVAKGVALGTGTEITVEFDVGGFYPVTFNNTDLVERLTPSLKRATNNKVYEMTPSTGAEDFSFFSNVIPGMYFWLGVNAPGVMEAPGNHSPYFVVDDGALDEGLKALVYLVEDYPKE
ncbi:M20 family metallopeptidase [Gammaproteobacteria bacterium]|nr:M20 family metallopeptidase [Gammaproteobacteria bacterium]MDA9124069.1 M20 family metallopeptidase [Gammaproteobacteria bacterium]MDC0005330.1 M20 family metallopeptidase [Gammaproteobacteria bacterium]MDC1443832.1 M20 family metallopeptidase [Gammaproteobacteria bacterium]MDC1470456.1 M20 family metallopeptidase [Gammaproteobacteria bacterium]